MKAFIRSIAIAAILLAACSEDPEPTYTSLVGKWKFVTSTVAITGNFEIVEFSDVLMIGDAFGEFKLNGGTYKIDTKNEIRLGGAPGTFQFCTLDNAAQNKGVVFIDLEYSNDFKSITAKEFYYVDNNSASPTYSEIISIKRL